MKTVVLGPPPAELEQLIERRRAQGLDTFDEVWEGTYHMAPAPRFNHSYLDDAVAVLLHSYARAAGLIGSGPFNLGGPDDYRVPDRGYHRKLLDVVFCRTAAIAIEIVSPDDESYQKLPFYALHHVDEVIFIEPATRRVRIFSLAGDRYAEVDRSTLLDVDTGTVQSAISWP
ncbi:MAG: Uma2 family endonuclease [Acidimicrobiales bacterium]